MLTIQASYGLKQGKPNYGSETALCSVSLEVSDTLSANELRQKIHSAFQLVREQVKTELDAKKPVPLTDVPENRVELPVSNKDKASNKQLAYLSALASQQGLSISDLNARVKELYGVDNIYDLNRKDASRLLVSLQTGSRRKAA